MKSIVTLIILAAILFSGCNKEIFTNPAESDDTLTITACGGEVSRTELSGMSIKWLATDKLGMLSAESGKVNSCYTTSASKLADNGFKASFTGKSLTSNNYIAYYPYQISAPISSSKAFIINAQEQNGNSSAHSGNYDFTYSSPIYISGSTTLADVRLKHALSMIKLDIKLASPREGVTVTGIEIIAHKDGIIPVNAFAEGIYYDPYTGEIAASNQVSSVSLRINNCPDLTTSASDFSAYLLLFNKTADYDYNYTLSIKVTTGQGEIVFDNIRTITSAEDELAPGKLYNKTLTLPTDEMKYFPDDELRQSLSNSYGLIITGDDINPFSAENRDIISQITELDIPFTTPAITSLHGINHFTNLKKLKITNAKAYTLDIRKNSALEELEFTGNKNITTINTSNNRKLTVLRCDNNNLNSLDLRNNPSLKKLNCSNNKLQSLDISNNTLLTSLDCSNNAITELTRNNHRELTELLCNYNQLSELYLGSMPKLASLNCSDNIITSLDPSNNLLLTSLNCSANLISSLNVSNNTSLSVLSCYMNNISTLDIRKTSLQEIYCGMQSDEFYNSKVLILTLSSQQNAALQTDWQQDYLNTDVSITIK